jgi:DNA-binding NtrC family response regulator/HAMP domain-containing protein
MGFKSLKGKLILAVASLVIGSGLLISLLASERQRASLLETMMAQGENIAHAVALETADKVLINDLVGLQKMLEHQLRSNNGLGYLFIQRGEEILAHTFPGEIPIGLLQANTVTSEDQRRIQKISSTDGDHYLDIAWPVFEGKAGVLRLGLSEKPYRDEVKKLWLEMGLLTAGILLFSLVATLLFVRRIIGPISALAKATQKIDRGEAGVRVAVTGDDEVSRLASSFNRMVARIEGYTQTLEGKALELERANQQTRTFCDVVREIGALRSLQEIGTYLIKQFQDMLQCKSPMAFMLLNTSKDSYFVFPGKGPSLLRETRQVEALSTLLGDLTRATAAKKVSLRLPEGVREDKQQYLIPVRYEEETFGLLLIPCKEACGCSLKEIEGAELILNQCSGVLRRALLQEEGAHHMEMRLETSAEFHHIVGRDPKMQAIFRLTEDIAPTDATVLIQGESGTGKEMVARAIHQLSLRRNKPFVVIDCSAYPATLLESELFGHEKGAFTGATRQKIGRFEQADGGTVFLDEVGEIPPSAQIKLLRVLQTQRFERLGGEKTLAVNVRFIAATNKDLLQEVKAGGFREDLFYRLNVIPLQLPPLRERPNDIPLLARHFLSLFGREQKKEIQDFSSEAMRAILNYPWPGNVRELENSIEHAVVLAKGSRVEGMDLPSAVIGDGNRAANSQSRRLSTIAEREQELLKETLEKCAWNKKEAAKNLGISRNTLYQKMRRYGILNPTAH